MLQARSAAHTLAVISLVASLAACSSAKIGPPATAAAPTIQAFSATPPTIQAGQNSTLAWSVTGATSLSISAGVGTVTGTSVSVSPAATTTYTKTRQTKQTK